MPTTTIRAVALALVVALAHPAAAQERPMLATTPARAVPNTASTASNTTTAATTAARDRAAVTEVLTAIAHGADLRQWAQVRAAFADAVTLDYGTPEALAPGAIVARWRPLLEAFDATQHQLFDVAVTLAGDSASATARFQATHTLDGAVWVLTGRYEYALRRSPDGWQVTAMRMRPGVSSGDPTLLDVARARAARDRAGVAR